METAARLQVARRLVLEATATEAFLALVGAQVPTLVLKGMALQHLLAAPGEQRVYGDVDLLVDPRHWRRALQVLHGLGFRDPLSQQRTAERDLHSWMLVRGHPSGRVELDLHHRLHSSRVSSRRTWAVASRDPLPVPGSGAATLLTTSLPVTLFHLGVAAEREAGGRHAGEFRRFVALHPGLEPAAREVAAQLGCTAAYDGGAAVSSGALGQPPGRTLVASRWTFWSYHLRWAPDARARWSALREMSRLGRHRAR